MSDYDLTITFSTNALRLLREMPSAAARASGGIARALDKQNELTISYAQRNKLSGPRPTILGVITNRLRSSLRRATAQVSGSTITSGIGSNVEYAAIHEFGFDGNVTVKSYVRKQPSRDLVTGKKQKLVASGLAFVKSFTRHMRMPERSFVRSSINERLPEYNSALSGGVIDALGGAS